MDANLEEKSGGWPFTCPGTMCQSPHGRVRFGIFRLGCGRKPAVIPCAASSCTHHRRFPLQAGPADWGIYHPLQQPAGGRTSQPILTAGSRQRMSVWDPEFYHTLPPIPAQVPAYQTLRYSSSCSWRRPSKERFLLPFSLYRRYKYPHSP